MKFYRALTPIMVRTPMGHLSKYSDVFTENDVSNTVKKILEDHAFLNALKLANPSFFSYVQQHFLKESNNYSKKALHTLIKFYSRFSTRATPFGGYACISLADWGQNTNFKLEIPTSGILQPDTQWLYKIISLLEDDLSILCQLRVQSNKNIYFRLDRCINPYISNYGKLINYSSNLTIRNSPLLEKILAYSREGVDFENLVNFIQSETSSDRTKIVSYLKTLLHNEFLITNLKVLSTTEDPLVYIISLLSKMELDSKNAELLQKLKYINNKLENPACIQSPEFGEYLSDVVGAMSLIANSDNYIYSYYRRNSKCHNIGFNVRKELNQLNKLFSHFNIVDTETKLVKDFKHFFVDKYGTYCAVPLTLLLEQYEFHDFPTPSIRASQHLENLILDAIKQNKRTIHLSDYDLSNIAPQGNMTLPPSPSFEICCSINAESYESLNNNQFEILIGPNIGANKLNCHYSRFNRSYTCIEKEKLYKNYRLLEDAISGNYVTINIFELPQNTRVQNICYSMPFYESLNFSLYTDSDISINDIYVCYDEKCERLYLYSQKHNSVVKFISDNMLNPIATNYVGRLLKDISSAMEFHYVNALTAFRSSSFKYIPKIIYSRIVLMPETWKISKNDFDLTTVITFRKTLRNYKAKWDIPDLIYLTERDTRVLVDLSNEIFIDLLFNEIKKHGTVTLTNEFSDKSWLEDTGSNHYSNEFVFSFIYESSLQEEYFYKSKGYCDKQRLLLPGNTDWLYYKIYLKNGNVNEFFKKHMPFFKSITSKYNAKLFFIRYSDPNFHIRMRINCNGEINQRSIQKEIQDYMCTLIKCGLIMNTNLSIYEREIERYGNEHTIQFVEHYFCDDSSYCIDLLQEDESKIFNKCIRDALVIMKTFYPDINILYSIIEKYPFDVKVFSKEFYANKAQYLTLYESTSEVLSWENSLKMYHGKVLDNLKLLHNKVEDIMFSLIHMHCNRLSGSRDFEKAILAATKLIIKYKLHWQKQENKE